MKRTTTRPRTRTRAPLLLLILGGIAGLFFAFSHAYLPNAVYFFLGLEAWKLTGGEVSPSMYGLLGLITLIALGAAAVEWTARKLGGRTQ